MPICKSIRHRSLARARRERSVRVHRRGRLLHRDNMHTWSTYAPYRFMDTTTWAKRASREERVRPERKREAQALDVTSCDVRIAYDCGSLWNPRAFRPSPPAAEIAERSMNRNYNATNYPPRRAIAIARGIYVPAPIASERTRNSKTPLSDSAFLLALSLSLSSLCLL